MSKKILILGGARFHGLLLAESLSKSGEEVYVLNRGNYRSEYKFQIKHLIADRNDVSCLERVLNGQFDVVVDNNAYNSAQVKTILNLVEKRCGHYIFTSSIATYLRHASAKPLYEKEATGIQEELFSPKIKDYALGKLAAEEEIREKHDGLNYTILRLPNVFGEGDFAGKLFSFYRELKKGKKIFLEKEIEKFSLIYAPDASSIFEKVICNKNCFRRTINACDSSAHDYKEFFEKIFGLPFDEKNFSLIPTREMQNAGYFPTFPWGPVMSAELLEKLIGKVNFTSLGDWGERTLKWEIDRFKSNLSNE